MRRSDNASPAAGPMKVRCGCFRRYRPGKWQPRPHPARRLPVPGPAEGRSRRIAVFERDIARGLETFLGAEACRRCEPLVQFLHRPEECLPRGRALPGPVLSTQALYDFDITGRCSSARDRSDRASQHATPDLEDEDSALRRYVDRIGNHLKGGARCGFSSPARSSAEPGLPDCLFCRTSSGKSFPPDGRLCARASISSHGRSVPGALFPMVRPAGRNWWHRRSRLQSPEPTRQSRTPAHYAKHPHLCDPAYIPGAPRLCETGTCAARGSRQNQQGTLHRVGRGSRRLRFFRRELEPEASSSCLRSRRLATSRRSPSGRSELEEPSRGKAVQARLLPLDAGGGVPGILHPARTATDAFVNYPWFRDTVGERLGKAEDRSS